jgi:hypothetical protein
VEEMYMYEARDQAETEAKAAEAAKAALAEAQKQEAWKQAKAKSLAAGKKARVPRAPVPSNDLAGSPEVESEYEAVTKRKNDGLRAAKLGQWMTNGTGPGQR